MIVLNAVLRNQAPFAQEYPSLELTLTDERDEAVARRVLAPADYLVGTGADVVARGIGAGADAVLRVYHRYQRPARDRLPHVPFLSMMRRLAA